MSLKNSCLYTVATIGHISIIISIRGHEIKVVGSDQYRSVDYIHMMLQQALYLCSL